MNYEAILFVLAMVTAISNVVTAAVLHLNLRRTLRDRPSNSSGRR